jgi:heme/copper-type cytochrome/quinol oxidase subunit 2
MAATEGAATAASFMRRAAVLFAAVLALGAAASAPQDELELIASRAGFRPKLLKLRKGDTARLLLKTADEEHCFALDAWRVEKRIAPGKTTSVELTPDRAGEFTFYCCLEPDNKALSGKLVVVE